jgi:hypothetical protein
VVTIFTTCFNKNLCTFSVFMCYGSQTPIISLNSINQLVFSNVSVACSPWGRTLNFLREFRRRFLLRWFSEFLLQVRRPKMYNEPCQMLNSSPYIENTWVVLSIGYLFVDFICGHDFLTLNEIDFWYSIVGRLTQTSVLLRSALFWDITRRRVIIVYRRFGTTFRSHLHGSKVRVGKKESSL